MELFVIELIVQKKNTLKSLTYEHISLKCTCYEQHLSAHRYCPSWQRHYL